jgi:osmotically-inducible protein OsmY
MDVTGVPRIASGSSFSGQEVPMSTTNLTGTDLTLRDAVVRQLDWDPQVDASAIGVSVGRGTVTLTGTIDSCPGKLAAERAVKRVAGVRAVANDLEVRLTADRTDADVAADIVRTLESRSTVPRGVQASVHYGYVSLTGAVNWLFQKRDVAEAVQHVRGVRGVFNHLRAVEHDVRHHIVQALYRSADLDAGQIDVMVSGSTAILTGTVGTWLQREAAERAAASAPGIADVHNLLAVGPPDEDDSDDMC